MNIFERKESNVRSYCRSFPIVFNGAKNALLYTQEGEQYIDFLSGAGAMNFGHNNPYIKGKIMDYLAEDRIIQALDMYTEAKEHFLQVFEEKILLPKNLDYKIMCCGPTGTNAIEASLKLARKNKGRTNVIAFAGAFHGMTLGSLALTTDKTSREGASVALGNVSFAPYCTDFSDYKQSLQYLEWMLTDDHSGIDKPAAIVLETIQAEGGINVATVDWLRGVREICDTHDVLMIVDDIQVGIGRSGDFFSWERAGIVPDMVVLSKSIGGFGLPMALLLLKPELDIFRPAEHNGTFRGNQLGFVGSAAAIEYFVDKDLPAVVKNNGTIIEKFFTDQILPLNNKLSLRGLGMIWGIDFSQVNSALSKDVMAECVQRHLIIERAGRHDSVLKIMPPLTVEKEILLEGLAIIRDSIQAVFAANNL